MINKQKIIQLGQTVIDTESQAIMDLHSRIDDNFVKACSRKGYAPQIVLERIMNKFLETGQM